MPVYKNLDNVVGFFHIKDFMKTDQKDFNINNILREVLYVAPKSPILDFLKTIDLQNTLRSSRRWSRRYRWACYY